jgi:hypothetical protein
MTDLYGAALAAEDTTMATSGGTFTRDTLAPTAPAGEAYAVGGILPGRKVAEVAHYGELAAAILNMRADMADRAPGGYIGTWIDDGTVYVDAVVILPDLASAGILARTLGERAVFNFVTGESIAAEDAYPCRACIAAAPSGR